MDMAYPCKKKQKNFAGMYGYKKKEAFRSEQYSGLKIPEKFNFNEIWNKYNENTFAIYNFF